MPYTLFRPRPRSPIVRPGWSAGLGCAHAQPEPCGLVWDYSGHGRHGSFLGAEQWQVGPFGAQVATGGVPAGVRFGAPAELKNAPAGTVAVLARLDSLGSSGDGSGLCNLASWEGTAGSDVAYRLCYYQPNTAVYWQPGADNSYQIGPFAPPAVGDWELIVGRLRPTSATAGEVSLWYGPRPVGSATFSGAAFGGSTATAVAAFGGSSYYPSRQWNGVVAAHYAWSRALDDSEIVALAADPFAPVRSARGLPSLGIAATGRFRRVGMAGGFPDLAGGVD